MEGAPGLGVEADAGAGPPGVLFELEVQVRLQVVGALGQARQPEAPEPDPGQQVLAEAAGADLRPQVPVRAADQLEVAAHLRVGPDREEGLLLDRPQQHRLLVGPQLPHLVQEEQAPVGRPQQPRPGGGRPREGPADVPEERAHRRVPADGRAVDLHQRPGQLPAALLELVDPAGQPALARPGGPGEQDRVGPVRRDVLDLGDQPVERRVPGRDPALEEALPRVPLPGVPLRDPVVAGQVQIDLRDLARSPGPRPLGRGALHEHPGQVPGLGEQEQADLGHVRAGGDVHAVVLGLGVEGVGGGEVVQLPEDRLEVPGPLHRDLVQADLGLRGHPGHVRGGLPGQPGELALVQQLQPVDDPVLVLAQRDRRPPTLPPTRPVAPVEVRAEQAEGHLGAGAGHECRINTIQEDRIQGEASAGTKT